MDLATIRRNVREVGTARVIGDLGLRAVNHVFDVKILKGIRIETVDAEFLKCDERYRGQFLDEAALRAFATDPQYQLTTTFLEEALPKGDECYAFLDGATLAAYGWYSNKPTGIDIPDLVLHFDDRYIYMYKGFTHPSYRGQRLHAVGMTRALEAYLARGYKGIVSYVEWNNFGSLRSCYRMGYRDFGNIFAANVLGRYVLRSGAGCERYGFRLASRPRAPARD